jgi:hypothetical protein
MGVDTGQKFYRKLSTLPNDPNTPLTDRSTVKEKEYVFSWPALRLAFGDYSVLSVPMLPVPS